MVALFIGVLIMRSFRVLLFFLSSSLVSTVFASEPLISWRLGGQSSSYTGTLEFTNPHSACEAVYSFLGLQNTWMGPLKVQKITANQYECYGSNGGTAGVVNRFFSCVAPNTLDPDTEECFPPDPEEPKQCEAGLEFSRYFPARKTESGYLITDAPNPGCFGGCRYDNVLTIGKGGCVLGGETGHMCMENYISDGTECEVGDGGGDGGGGDGGGGDGDGEGGGGDGPGEDDPDGDPDPNCRRFTNADGSWGYDCSPRPDPDENNECPPGYQMQGNTCFRIPPDHPDYDPDKDPQKPGDGGDGDTDPTKPGTGGDGDLKGVAQETTLKSIDKTLKDIDGSIKSGNSTTHSLLQGIKDAIGKIPGGGGGSGNGNGSGAGDGDGEGGPTKPESGSFDEAIAEQDEAIEGFKEELKTKFNEFKQYQIEGLTLSGGGGSLPSVTVSFGMFGTHTLDFGQYAEPLSNLGGIFVFMCGLLAVLIIFVRG